MIFKDNDFGGMELPGGLFGKLFGPGQPDQIIRQAVQICWMALPEDRRNAQELTRQVRRLVERALEDFREDEQAFGPGEGGTAF